MSTVRSDDELYTLLTRAGRQESLPAGEVIFNKGDGAEGMYIVNRGTVELRDGDRVIDTVTAPNLFGELALIESEPRSLTAVAAGDTELYMVPTRQFWVLVHETPYFAQLVMRVMARRLHRVGATT
jgi:CRP/FNR family cyclic AMP-dependent transcriptional regulator